MTEVAPQGDVIGKKVYSLVSADVNFPKGRFPDYKVMQNNVILEREDHHDVVALRELVAKETSDLLEQRRRLSVRDLRIKFEKGLAAATKQSNEEKQKETASLDRQVLLKKLRDVLDSLKGRVAGRNQDDAEEAISLVEALAIQLTQREGELLYEKVEVKKLMEFLKQATEDAKRLAEHERNAALEEVEKAHAAIRRIEQAMHEYDQTTRMNNDREELEELRKEIHEARRIKMLHQPSKVMDMECELIALRGLLSEKTELCDILKKEVVMIKQLEEVQSVPFEFQGSATLGSQLCIVPRVDNAPDISNSSIWWYRLSPTGNNKEIISGATKMVYAPEPLDVGRLLEADITLGDQICEVKTANPMQPPAGLDRFVEALSKRPDNEFDVIILQINGSDTSSTAVHVLHIGKQRMKLRKGNTTKASEAYSSSMQLCGARGGSDAPSKSIFWVSKKGQSFVLAFETYRERNAAIMLARIYASDCGVVLAGPGDWSAAGGLYTNVWHNVVAI